MLIKGFLRLPSDSVRLTRNTDSFFISILSALERYVVPDGYTQISISYSIMMPTSKSTLDFTLGKAIPLTDDSGGI